MSHSTLDDFYKGMRQPRYDGANVLSQLKSLQGGASMQQQTATVTQTKTVEGTQVPPLAGAVAEHHSMNSFDRHVAASMTEQATSKMFNQMPNEQSFGR